MVIVGLIGGGKFFLPERKIFLNRKSADDDPPFVA
jgi:hypothetical protein